MSSGIYQIKNQINGNRYVGSAVNLAQRWRAHLSRLGRGQHKNEHLQRAYDKYGKEAFSFSVLEDVKDVSQLIPCEQHSLDTLKPEYNIAPIAGSQLGLCHSLETRRKLSEGAKGRRSNFFGKHHSDEAKRKLSEAVMGERNPNFGKPLSAETRRKIGEAQKGERGNMYGRHHGDETRAKISKALKGRLLSEETKQKLREVWTPERRQAQSDARSGEQNPMYGKHHSENTRLKMRRSHKARQRRIRIAHNAKEKL